MRYYIKSGTKEEFLEKYATEIDQPTARLFDCDTRPEDMILIVLIQNPGFSAAGIAVHNVERDVFLAPDHRDKKYYLCPIGALVENAGQGPAFQRMLRRGEVG